MATDNAIMFDCGDKTLEKQFEDYALEMQDLFTDPKTGQLNLTALTEDVADFFDMYEDEVSFEIPEELHLFIFKVFEDVIDKEN